MTAFISLYILIGIAFAAVAVNDQTNKSETFVSKIFIVLATLIFWLPVFVSVVIWPPKLAPTNIRTNSATSPIESVDVIEVESTRVVDSKNEVIAK